jgi:hypothetical protein
MIINKDSLLLHEQFNIKIPEATLIKLEDGIKNNKEMLITIAASHYGFRNRNWTVYRHDTVRNDIQSFVSPKPKPIIQQHRPKSSQVFGHIIAADYHLTDYYDTIATDHKVEKLTTDEYISLVKNTIIPLQKKNLSFNGLAYLELVGKLTNRDGIRKVIDKEFLRVSIGAAPNKLICSECGQDQTKKICKHYGNKGNDTFMLAESLQYKELSFVDKPADPFGMITYIHDEELVCTTFSDEDCFNMDAIIDAIPMKDFFNLTDKKIVCVDNICTIINREDEIMKVKRTVDYTEEFGSTVVDTHLKGLDATLTLDDSDLSDLPDRSFAIVQKDSEGIKRRFPLNDEVNVKLAMGFLCDAEDLSPTEMEKATAAIEKAAKKCDLEYVLRVKDEATDTTITDTGDNGGGDSDDNGDDTTVDLVTDACNAFVDQLKVYIEDNFNEDGTLKDADSEPSKPSPLTVLFSILASFASEVRYAGNMLEGSIAGYLQELGKESIATATKDELQSAVNVAQDALKEVEEENALLSDQNMELNRQLRDHFVEEIIAHKAALGTLADGEIPTNSAYCKLGYESLKVILNDFRNMRVKLHDNTVNNSVSITKINDPTQIADSASDDDGDVDLNSPQDKPNHKVTAKEAIDIINSLKARHGL